MLDALLAGTTGDARVVVIVVSLFAAFLSGLLGFATGAVGLWVQLRKDKREQAARDDEEADRTIGLLVQQRNEYERALVKEREAYEAKLQAQAEQHAKELQELADRLAKDIQRVEARVDTYGCENAPECDQRRPLGSGRRAKPKLPAGYDSYT